MKKIITGLAFLSAIAFAGCSLFSTTNMEDPKDAPKIKEAFVKATNDQEVVAITIAGKEALSSTFYSGTITYIIDDTLTDRSFYLSSNDGKLTEARSGNAYDNRYKIMQVDKKPFPSYNKAQKVSNFKFENVASGIATAKQKLTEYIKEMNEKIGKITCSEVTLISSDNSYIAEYRLETDEGTKTSGRSRNTSYYQFKVTIAPDGTTEITQK